VFATESGISGLPDGDGWGRLTQGSLSLAKNCYGVTGSCIRKRGQPDKGPSLTSWARRSSAIKQSEAESSGRSPSLFFVETSSSGQVIGISRGDPGGKPLCDDLGIALAPLAAISYDVANDKAKCRRSLIRTGFYSRGRGHWRLPAEAINSNQMPEAFTDFV